MGCSLQQREVSKSAAGDGVEAQGGYYSKAASMSAVCLTKHLVTVKNCLALFLDLLFPALLCSLNPLQHCVSFGLGTVHRGTHLLNTPPQKHKEFINIFFQSTEIKKGMCLVT